MQELDHQSILITGGTGSLGKTLCRRILANEWGMPERVLCFSRDEAKQDAMRQVFNDKRLHFRLGDVRRYSDVQNAVQDASIVINAAALKQVPSCEYAPEQAVLTNYVGPLNLVRASQQAQHLHTVVGVSTDKACEPVNVMGMTKALQERIFTAANLDRYTRFVCVRYGNVLASRGSVIPLFQRQIAEGGPVTITAPWMTRFLLSLNEAVDTVMAAIASGNRGETYVPRAKATTLAKLASVMCERTKTPTVVTGIRPGEKTHETLISEAECTRTVLRDGYFVIRPMLPELARETDEPKRVTPFRSSDEDVQLSVDETRELLRKHGLLEPTAHGEVLA